MSTLQSTIENAKEILNKFQYEIPAYVVESKLGKGSRKTFYGFTFHQEDKKMNEWFQNSDGSFSRVVHIVQP